MATLKDQIISSAELTFDTHGFTASGIDGLANAAGVSTRTLYRHVGSKTLLMVAVLEGRAARFFNALPIESVDAVFEGLTTWIVNEGSRGCLFLRAQGESGGTDSNVAAAVASYRTRLRALIRHVVAEELGRDDKKVADQLLVLIEGATSASAYVGSGAVEEARYVASVVMAQALSASGVEREA